MKKDRKLKKQFPTVLKLNKLLVIIALTYTSCILVSCKKLVKIDLPVDRTTAEATFNSSGSSFQVLAGIYRTMLDNGNYLCAYGDGFPLQTSRLSDELNRVLPGDTFNINNLSSDEIFIWNASYEKEIFQCNSLIEGVSASKGITATDKAILLGEAKFIRAYTYFQLVNFYGDVPLVLTTNYKTNLNIPRSSKDLVYAQIVSDLLDAQAGLKNDYLSIDPAIATNERVRPNIFAATALLARIYLYQEKWAKAEGEATKVILSSKYELLTDLNEVFKANSREAIWQLQPINDPNANANTYEGQTLIPFPGGVPKYALTDFLLNSFEPSDKRKRDWTTTITSGNSSYIIPFKYKIGNNFNPPQPQIEYNMMLRLAEQFLIRAEARTHLGKLLGAESAQADVNAIRNRAGLPNTTSETQDDLLKSIAQERRVELFTESGHRWLDLKRTNMLDKVMGTPGNICQQKGGTWASYKSLMPIPRSEIRLNPALRGHQNPGYSE